MARQSSEECEDWYHGRVARNHAEKLVMNPALPRGAFLLRERETDNGKKMECLKYSFSQKFFRRICADHQRYRR